MQAEATNTYHGAEPYMPAAVSPLASLLLEAARLHTHRFIANPKQFDRHWKAEIGETLLQSKASSRRASLLLHTPAAGRLTRD